MAFLNEQGLSKLWGIIKTLVSSTESSLQGKIDKKLDESTYNSQINAGVKNPNALKVKVNEETTSYDYDGSAEKNLAIKAGENITISRSEGVITISSSGELTGTIENAVQAEKDASGNVITATYATKAEAQAAKTAADEAKGHSEGVAGDLSTEIANRTNSDNALSGRISTLEGQITGLTGAMHFKGKVTTDPTTITTGYSNGDVVIYNNKEYVFHGDESKFVELGDTTAELTEINSLKGNKVDKTTTITAGAGLSGGGALSGNITLTNTGVHSIATGSDDGTISVNTNGTSANVAVKGLKSAAYKEDTYFATNASVSGLSTTVDNLSTSKQDKLVNSDDITIGTDNKLTIAAIPDSVIEALA